MERNMFSSSRDKSSKANSNVSSPDLDEASILDDADAEVEVNLDVDEVPPQKPHFLDIDAVPPPDFEETFERVLSFGATANSSTKPNEEIPSKLSSSTGEQLKLDKKYEKDGEISDYELAASGYTKKEFTQDDNTLHLIGAGTNICPNNANRKKTKHFLDENPIPPDYMLVQEMREHRSLDRNFERHNEQRPDSPSSGPFSLSGRKGSGGSRASREFVKEPSYTLSRFLDSDAQGVCSPMSLPPPLTQPRLPRGSAWTESYSSYYNSMQPLSSEALSDVDSAMGSKVECVYSLLSMLGSNDPLEMSKKFLELSKTSESCVALRRSGCIPLLVQMMYSDSDENVQKYSSMALHNVIHSNYDEKIGRREAKVLRLLDQIMDYCGFLKTLLQSGGEGIADDSDRHPLAAMSSLMKVSFDEEHRHAMCELGALQAIPNLVHLDHAAHGPKPEDQCCNSLRRYALMALTNLTFGDENNKALLCSQKMFMEALVAQLDSAPDDLLQVTASVLRNLSWRADNNMKAVLNEIGTVTALAKAAMKNKNENTLKAILSALWNLSAHCSTNKAEFCSVEGALAFLVKMLTYEGPSKTLKIIENAGGILRNVSSHIAVRENYRKILREHNCLSILLQQLKSESLTVVSNSCGTLWNLSARCPEDQKFLWDNGAVPMLRSLIHSKHAMISEGSSSALKNLLNFRPSIQNQNHLDPVARSMGLKKLPTLNARKQKALEQELGQKAHAETCDNLDATPVPKENINNYDLTSRRYPLVASTNVGGDVVPNPPTSSSINLSSTRLTRSAMLTKSESRDSILSAKSDSAYENLLRSHSASSASRKTSQMAFTSKGRTTFALEPDGEANEEQPIDYSVKYNESVNSKLPDKSNVLSDNAVKSSPETESTYPTYQETDLDQPTDFSLRYAENQLESDADISPPEVATASSALPNIERNREASSQHKTSSNGNNEILLILEDSVKCYQTEDTPYVISNAASVSDLRQSKIEAFDSETKAIEVPNEPTKKFNRTPQYALGTYTPEKPINYAEEGTPGYFSRYESLSSLDESPPQGDKTNPDPKQKASEENKNTNHPDKENLSSEDSNANKESSPETGNANSNNLAILPSTNVNSAQETPLMFSRHSSMDSLVEEDVGPLDDKSSVVSDFSRLASGVISPSEIPDSPTQSMPQSPRRNSAIAQPNCYSGGVSPLTPRSSHLRGPNSETKRPLRSVFEDDLNTFHVENTPAQFSCATSLSNLSMIDDERDSPPNNPALKPKASSSEATTISTIENNASHSNLISEGEEEEPGNNNDDLLLANCINIGMNRTSTVATTGNVLPKKQLMHQIASTTDEPRHYYTEDTPAFLSKVGSNSNLSAISMCSSSLDQKNPPNNDLNSNLLNDTSHKRESLNLSDDVSSNASESGATALSYNILQQCILDGMQKPNQQNSSSSPKNHNQSFVNQTVMDPLAMMRKGGNILPPYLAVKDEMNKYLVEDSPCNFSVVSGLSNLTVGSSRVGPAVHLNEALPPANERVSAIENLPEACASLSKKTPRKSKDTNHKEIRNEPQWNDDSLSSLSIDSEDDTNLLSQAIAAGCNRPKSNLGFSSTTSSSANKRSTSLSSSQPININAATSASSLNSVVTVRNFHKQNQTKHSSQSNVGHNDSYSSVDSSDSNDNQSKSLFELCILTGMNKNSSNVSASQKTNLHNIRGKAVGDGAAATQSNPNLKVFDYKSSSLSTNRHLRERERKDEKLLLECINTGISKKINSGGGGGGVSSKSSLENRNPKHNKNEMSLNFDEMSSGPKNGQATSVAAQEVYHQIEDTTSINALSIAAPDVEANIDHNPMKLNNSNSISTSRHIINNNNNSTLPENIIDGLGNQHKTAAVVMNTHQNENPQSHENVLTNGIGFKEERDYQSLEQIPSDESNQSFILETTVSLDKNQETPKNSQKTIDKHKDPDLMLKSVERLTLEFVTSAEQLRTNSNKTQSLESSQKAVVKSHPGTNSNNTWNEDSCPNDVSFPSVSVTAPVVNSLSYDDTNDEDATEADHKELHEFYEINPINEEHLQPSLGMFSDDPDGLYKQPESLPTETNTLINGSRKDSCSDFESNSSSSINFQVGGEVQSAAASLSNKNILLNCGSAMTNSTIMAIEARALAENLQRANIDDNGELTFSVNSLDLDNIRPPSGMESLNMSGFYHESLMAHSQPNSIHRSFLPHSPQLSTRSPKFPRKSLPAGLMARRALGQIPGHLLGSNESVNSSCNLLDNIKPPSLMDELLDSMISVASIQSEVADLDCQSMATTVSITNYETAAGGNEFDDNTITLQSCCDLTLQDDEEEASHHDALPLSNDSEFSSAASTPKKSLSSPLGVKRTLTPKQKRKIAQDRYKTYTIAADYVLNEQQNEEGPEEILRVEVNEADTTTITMETSKAEEFLSFTCNTNTFKRRGSQERYKTQDIVCPLEILQQASTNNQHENENFSLTSTEECLSEDLSSIRAMTQRFKFIRPQSPATSPLKKENHPSTNQDLGEDLTSLEYEQNSETESCNGHHHDKLSDIESDDNSNEIPKARIVTQPLAETEEEEAKAKAIRGKKKTPYVSPYSMHFQKAKSEANKSAVQASDVRKRQTNTSPSMKNTTNTSKIAQRKKIPEASSGCGGSSNNNAIQRQGTFVKEDLPPNNAPIQVPEVQSSSPGRKASKLPTKSNNNSPKKSNLATTRKLDTSAKTFLRKTPASNLKNLTQRSNSNANIQISSSAARIAVLTSRVSATTPPSRSNSNLTGTQAASAAAIKVSQAQSRIASIWKKVDDAKTKQSQAKTFKTVTNTATSNGLVNKRVQSQPQTQIQTKTSTTINKKSQAQQVQQQKQSLEPAPQLVRSSTFDATPPLSTTVAATTSNTQIKPSVGGSKFSYIKKTSVKSSLPPVSTASRK